MAIVFRFSPSSNLARLPAHKHAFGDDDEVAVAALVGLAADDHGVVPCEAQQSSWDAVDHLSILVENFHARCASGAFLGAAIFEAQLAVAVVLAARAHVHPGVDERESGAALDP